MKKTKSKKLKPKRPKVSLRVGSSVLFHFKLWDVVYRDGQNFHVRNGGIVAAVREGDPDVWPTSEAGLSIAAMIDDAYSSLSRMPSLNCPDIYARMVYLFNEAMLHQKDDKAVKRCINKAYDLIDEINDIVKKLHSVKVDGIEVFR